MFNLESFTSEENIYLIPNYIKDVSRQQLQDAWESLDLKSHVFILSSGTSNSGKLKSYALSKRSILNNANAVNLFLNADQSKRWISSLPHFHIGGLSIYARAALLGCEVISFNEKWGPVNFHKCVLDNRINYLSVVPTQLYDLVSANLIAPCDLEGVFVGGDFLPDFLRERALELGWPLIMTYGMTETSSQIASSYSSDCLDGFLELLPIHKINNDTGSAVITSDSLLSATITLDGVNISVLMNNKDSLTLPDNLEVRLRDGKQFIRPRGRIGDEFKVNGRLVSFFEVKNIAYQVFFEHGVEYCADIQLQENPRSGKSLLFILEENKFKLASDILDMLRTRLGHLLDIHVKVVSKLALTDSGKIKKV